MFRLEAHAQELARQFEQPGMLRSVRERIKASRRASLEQRDALKRVLVALEPDKIPTPVFFEHFTGKADKAPALLEHFGNLHRDWCWGGAENNASLEAIASLLPPDYSAGKLLVPGAGACRLAYDIHQQLKPEATIATEVNALLFLCAKRILAGGTLNLYELPSLPVDSAAYAVKRELRAPAGTIKGDFQLVLSDMGVPCFKPEALANAIPGGGMRVRCAIRLSCERRGPEPAAIRRTLWAANSLRGRSGSQAAEPPVNLVLPQYADR